MADYNKVRRTDREVKNIAFYRNMLKYSASCSIALSDANGNPYVNSNFFLYDEGEDVLYFHTAGNGYTRTIIEQNNNVYISVARTGRLYPAKRAFDFGTEYYSVTIFGNAEIVTDETSLLQFFNNFLQKYFPHVQPGEYEPPTIEQARRATIYKVTIADWTAKKHEVADDYAGAVLYNEVISPREF